MEGPDLMTQMIAAIQLQGDSDHPRVVGWLRIAEIEFIEGRRKDNPDDKHRRVWTKGGRGYLVESATIKANEGLFSLYHKGTKVDG
jgi:hypothetical protein